MRLEQWLYTVPLRLRSLFKRNQVEQELSEELQDHLDHLIAENIARGKSHSEARAAAMRAMDGLEQQKEACRDTRRVNYIEDLVQDIRFGMRMLRTNIGLTTVAVVTLALGVGAATSIFSVVNSVLFRPLPFHEPDRLVVLREAIPNLAAGNFPVSAPDVADFRRLNTVFEDVGAFLSESMDLSGAGAPLRVDATRTSAAVFRLLQVSPHAGRIFTDEEDAIGNNVAILGYSLWQSRYAGDPAIVGKTIHLDRQPYEVIGVMPRDFEFPPKGLKDSEPADVWVPIAFTPAESSARGDNFNCGVMARLKPGVTLGAANSNVELVASQIKQQFYPAAAQQFELKASVTPLHEFLVGNTRKLLWLLLGAVGVLLLIACANVANLLLAHGTARQKEIAVRVALGAARPRLVRQVLVESTLLGLLGGTCGYLSAFAGVEALTRLAAPILPRMQQVQIDTSVLAFALALSFCCGLLFGLVPALASTRTDVNEALKDAGRSASTGGGQRRLRDAFVVLQMALALLLVTSSGLLVRSFIRAKDTDAGIRSENVLTFSIGLPKSEYRSLPQIEGFFDRLRTDSQAIPGVISVAMSSDLPLNSSWTHGFTVEGHEAEQRDGLPLGPHTLVDTNYFQTLGIPLISGRLFNETEMLGKSNVVIISKGMAERYWRGENPIGGRIKWGTPESHAPWLTVVGVVGDTKQNALDAATKPHTFEPFAQPCLPEVRVGTCASRYITVRANTPPTQMVDAIRAAVQRIDPQQPIAEVRLMDDLIDESLAPRRFNTLLIATFAISALALAAIGIYGVLAYNVSRQTRELGVRIALGAKPSSILGMVLGNGLRLAIAGLVLGIVAALICTRLMSSLLYEVTATDPITFAAVSLVFLAVAFLACWIPGRRATKVDPMCALRAE